MNTKQMIAIVAVIAVALAGIGAAYAYSATLQNTSNVAPAQYLAISVDGDPAADDYSETFDLDDMDWNTLTFWNTGKQGIMYTPENATTNKDIAALTKECYALQVGHTLSLIVDSNNMGANDHYTFKVDTLRMIDGMMSATGLNSVVNDQQVYKMVYTVDGIPSVIDMNEASETLFVSDMHKDTKVTVALYAVQTTSATLIPKDNLSYETATFTFKAEAISGAVGSDVVASVNVPTHEVAGITENAGPVAFFLETGIGYYMDDAATVPVAGKLTINLPTGTYAPKCVSDEGIMVPSVQKISETGTVTFTETALSALDIDDRSGFLPDANNAIYASAGALDLSDLLLKASFGNNMVNYLVTKDFDNANLKFNQADGKTDALPAYNQGYTLDEGKCYDKLTFSYTFDGVTKATGAEFAIITLKLTPATEHENQVKQGESIKYNIPADAENYVLKVYTDKPAIATASVSDKTVTVHGVYGGTEASGQTVTLYLVAPDGTQVTQQITVLPPTTSP